MPIPIPNLDDRNYDQLIRETEALIGRYFPEYADIGPADPAVALYELFCYFFDLTMYQINRVTPDARDNFAALLGIKPEYGRPPEESLRKAHDKLARVERAITGSDIETLVKKASLNPEICSEPVRRVLTLPGKKAGDPLRVYVVQRRALRGIAKRHRQDLRNLYAYLRGCSPLGTRYRIAHAPVVYVDLSAEIVRRRDSTISGDKLAADILQMLTDYVNPLAGGPDGGGWAFGKVLSRGDIYSLIEGKPGVDHVRSLSLKYADDAIYGETDALPLPDGGLFSLRSGFSSVVVTG